MISAFNSPRNYFLPHNLYKSTISREDMTYFFIITAGSSHTVADAEQMAGLLQGAKFDPAETKAEADIIVFHVCANRTVSEEHFLQQVEQLRQEYPYKIIIISGCVVYALSPKLKKYSLVGTKQIQHIVEAVEESMNENVVQILESKEMPPLNMPRLRKNSPVIIMPINRGCGELIPTKKKKEKVMFFKSYSPEEIRTEVEKALQQGVTEIIFSSADASKYGQDLKTNLPTLLNSIFAIPGNFKLRLGLMNPANVINIRNDLISCFKQDKMYKFLYLPLFAGTNEILKEMKHLHSVEQFLQILTEFRAEIPELALMTDVVIGFPSETGEQYWETLNIIRKANPDVINILRHKAGEKEKKTETTTEDIIARRSSVLTDIYHNIARIQNERWLGWKGEVTITEKGPEAQQWIARNPAYKPVIIEGNLKIGDHVVVEITRAGTFELRGEMTK